MLFSNLYGKLDNQTAAVLIIVAILILVLLKILDMKGVGYMPDNREDIIQNTIKATIFNLLDKGIDIKTAGIVATNIRRSFELGERYALLKCKNIEKKIN